MNLKALTQRIAHYNITSSEKLNKALSGHFDSLNNQYVFCILISSAYCLQNEQLLNLFIKQAKLRSEDIDLDLIRHACVEASRLSVICHVQYNDTDELSKMVTKITTTKAFDKISYMTSLLAASSIFSSNKIVEHLVEWFANNSVSFESINSIFDLISLVRVIHEIAMQDSIRTYEFMAREESF